MSDTKKYTLPFTGDEIQMLLGKLISETEWDALDDSQKKDILYFVYEED